MREKSQETEVISEGRDIGRWGDLLKSEERNLAAGYRKWRRGLRLNSLRHQKTYCEI